jgi:hypothetical protein
VQEAETALDLDLDVHVLRALVEGGESQSTACIV